MSMTKPFKWFMGTLFSIFFALFAWIGIWVWFQTYNTKPVKSLSNLKKILLKVNRVGVFVPEKEVPPKLYTIFGELMIERRKGALDTLFGWMTSSTEKTERIASRLASHLHHEMWKGQGHSPKVGVLFGINVLSLKSRLNRMLSRDEMLYVYIHLRNFALRDSGIQVWGPIEASKHFFKKKLAQFTLFELVLFYHLQEGHLNCGAFFKKRVHLDLTTLKNRKVLTSKEFAKSLKKLSMMKCISKVRFEFPKEKKIVGKRNTRRGSR